MKKTFIITIVSAFVLTLSLSSCKKDYTCECTILGQASSTAIDNEKKKDAEDACDAIETSAKLVDASASCSLK